MLSALLSDDCVRQLAQVGVSPRYHIESQRVTPIWDTLGRDQVINVSNERRCLHRIRVRGLDLGNDKIPGWGLPQSVMSDFSRYASIAAELDLESQ